jgi:acyl carrier protein
MINLNEFTKKFQEQFIDNDEIKLSAQTVYKDLGSWDSLTGMSVLVMIKDEFNVDLPLIKFKACKTVEDVYQEVLKIK